MSIVINIWSFLNEITCRPSVTVAKFVCVLIFLLALTYTQDCVCRPKSVTSLVFLVLSLCQVC